MHDSHNCIIMVAVLLHPFHISKHRALWASVTDYAFGRLLTETFEPELTCPVTQFDQSNDTTAVVEIGPRMSFSTAWSANAVSICHSCGLSKITRMEKSYRYQLQSDKPVSQQQQLAFSAMVSLQHPTVYAL